MSTEGKTKILAIIIVITCGAVNLKMQLFEQNLASHF